jgi:hypothetical protein
MPEGYYADGNKPLHWHVSSKGMMRLCANFFPHGERKTSKSSRRTTTKKGLPHHQKSQLVDTKDHKACKKREEKKMVEDMVRELSRTVTNIVGRDKCHPEGPPGPVYKEFYWTISFNRPS